MKSIPFLGLLAVVAAIATLQPAAIATTPLAQSWGIVDSETDNAKPANPTDSGITGNDDPSPSAQVRRERQHYSQVIAQTANMVNDSAAQRLAQRFGLNILNLTWEDTGRYKDSAVGPNISDMTIQVQQRDPQTGQYRLSLMPVIRHPNFSDETADVDLDQFFVLVGNEKGNDLERVSLRQLLGNLRQYLHEPDSWKGREVSLLAPRDSHALVSAQAAFLPIPRSGEAQFNPVLFNYQSYAENPAVLTILATREGTSMTVIDNTRDTFETGQIWGQRLFFNKNGDRASFTGQRISDFNRQEQARNPEAQNVSEADGVNMVLLIQVPLKQKQPPARAYESSGTPLSDVAVPAAAPQPESAKLSNVEAAVIGHGEVEGPFTEIDNLAIERDPRFPIRATVQFYKATSNGVVSEADMAQIHAQIRKVYDQGDYVGSLVTEGETGRPTEYDGPKQQPPGWWENFWQRHGNNTGQSRWEVWELWQRLFRTPMDRAS